MNHQPENKICQNCKQNFEITSGDFSFYEKIKVPAPTWCPRCRMKRRMVFRNERKLFRQVDMLTGESIVSLIPVESGHRVMRNTEWWAQEKWSSLDYGMEVDFSRPFLEQVHELFKKVPKYSMAANRMVNSDYSCNATDLKNCYLCFNSNFDEDCAYANGLDYSKDCYDVSHVQKSERCYSSFWITNSYETNFSMDCEDCVSVWFSKNCKGCTNCFGCVNLVNKSYCFFNEQLTKEEYINRFNQLKFGEINNLDELITLSREFWLKFPNKFMQGIKNIDVTGEYISNCKNVHNSYLVRGAKDSKYLQYSQTPTVNDNMDVTVGGYNSELIYECAVSGWGGNNFRFCDECWDGGFDFEYSLFCGHLASNLFGCVAIHKNSYCILNKQYSKEEYNELIQKIKKHMDDMPYIDTKGRVYKYGEFFPPEFSPFAYNQTIVVEHFDSSREEADAFGMRWDEGKVNEYKITIQSKDLPKSIETTEEYIVNEVIACAECGRAYRIILSEYRFLKNQKIALPRICPDCRHTKRISQRNQSLLYARTCMCDKENHAHQGKCEVEFETSYAPDRPEIVYCEKCYQQEVY